MEDINKEEQVEVTKRKEKLCILAEEVKERGVIDTVCSRIVLAVSGIKRFTNKLEGVDKKKVNIKEIGANF